MSNEAKENMYDLSAGGLCGVVLREPLMKKFAKIHHEYTLEIQKLLNANIDQLEASDWTLANSRKDDGEIKTQVIVHYYGPHDEERIKRRISLFQLKPVRKMDVCLENVTMEQAKEWCEERVKEIDSQKEEKAA